ncbi:unnamed protein product [Gordionus sp. m RMFG-2023]|uniref:transmembrane protein 192-like n=1 Tax=Gordionus sp. m RMFG-2023 TaxID=3053472 RepID=UPI0030DE3BB1
MVSLQDDSKQFVDIGVPEDDDEALIRNELSANQLHISHFIPMPIIPVLILEIAFVILLIAFGFLVETICKDKCQISPYFILQLSHVGMWFIAWIIDRYLHAEHFKSKIRGHLMYYYTTRWIRRCTFYVFCFGNAYLIIANIILYYYCDAKESTCFHVKFNSLNILQLSLVIESFFIIPAQILYVYHTIEFNKARPLPDIAQEDLASPELPSQTATTHLGFSSRDYVSEMIEKQADAIRALKNHNYILARKIYELQQNASMYDNVEE